LKRPSSPKAEIALLGSILFNPEVMREVATAVYPDDFYAPASLAVAHVIWDKHVSGEPIDAGLVYAELKVRRQDAVVGGHEGLMKFADGVAESSHALHYAKIVKLDATRRRVITMHEEGIRLAQQPDITAAGLLDTARQHIIEIERTAITQESILVSDALPAVIRGLDEIDEDGIRGIRSGYIDLDRILGGLTDQTYCIIAGYPGSGKTTLALNIIEKICVKDKLPAVVYSVEMPLRWVCENMLSSLGRVDLHDYQAEGNYQKIIDAQAELAAAPLYINDNSHMTPSKLAADARKLKMLYGIGIVVVDYIQIMKSDDKELRGERVIADISGALKSLAKELGVPVIAISQLNKDGGLAWSSTLEQNADITLRVDRIDGATQAKLLVKKNKRGRSGGKVDLIFVPQYVRFESAARKDAQDNFDF